MQRTWLLGVGVILIGAAAGCSREEDPGSTIGQTNGGGGSGGEAGSLSLGLFGGGAGGGGGGVAGAGVAGATGGSAGTHDFGGSSLGGGTSQAGSASSAAGMQSGGMCVRAPGTDADCADFYAYDPDFPEDPARPQAYSCSDRPAYTTLNGAHGGKCANVNFVAGANTGACCPP